MRYDHFHMLPERAFSPRCGRFGMTLEGGAADFVEDLVGGVGDAIGDVVDFAGDVVEGVVETVSDIGSDIDDFVNEEIPGGWGTVAAVTIAATTGIPTDFGASAAGAAEAAAASGAGAGTAAGLGAADAIAAAEWFGGAGAATAPGAIFGSTAPAASAFVPSAFESAVNTALGGGSDLGSFGNIGTAGFGSALPPASELASGLTAAGFAPGTSANLAGLTSAGTGATNLLGGATALSPLAGSAGMPIQNIIRAVNTANNLLGGDQQPTGQPTSNLGMDSMTASLLSQGLSMLEPGNKQFSLPGTLSATYLPAAAMTQQQQFLQQIKQLYPELRNVDDRLLSTIKARTGGHIPEFVTGATGHYVQGRGDGQSDDIPAMLADGEYVFDADTVAALGNGSNKAGAAALDKMRENIRKHKRAAPTDKIPPKAKSPLAYMKG